MSIEKEMVKASQDSDSLLATATRLYAQYLANHSAVYGSRASYSEKQGLMREAISDAQMLILLVEKANE